MKRDCVLVGKQLGDKVDFRLFIGMKEDHTEDVVVVNEFNTATSCSEKVLCTIVRNPDEVGIPNNNVNILDVCVNKDEGVIVRITGTVCPVNNTSCVNSLKIHELKSDGTDMEEVWVCPCGAQTLEQCPLSK